MRYEVARGACLTTLHLRCNSNTTHITVVSKCPTPNHRDSCKSKHTLPQTHAAARPATCFAAFLVKSSHSLWEEERSSCERGLCGLNLSTQGKVTKISPHDHGVRCLGCPLRRMIRLCAQSRQPKQLCFQAIGEEPTCRRCV